MLIMAVKQLLGILLAAEGPARFPPRIVWPMHQALKELDDEAGRLGFDRALPPIHFTPSADAGWRALDADEALLELRRDRVLRVAGYGPDSMLMVERGALVAYRRDLMRLDPMVTHLLQRSGRRWAALVDTSAKISSTAPRSSSATLRRATPN